MSEKLSFNNTQEQPIVKTTEAVVVEKKEEVMTPEENAKMEKLISETTQLATEVSQITPESILKMNEEKKAAVLLKMRNILAVGVALGAVALGANLEALNAAHKHAGDVFDPQVAMAVGGALTAIGSFFGVAFSQMMYKMKKTEIASMETQG